MLLVLTVLLDMIGATVGIRGIEGEKEGIDDDKEEEVGEGV